MNGQHRRVSARDRLARHAIVGATAVLLLAPAAWADDMPDLRPLFSALAALVFTFAALELTIIAVEALAYRHFLGLDGWQALGLSMVANTASVLIGLGLEICGVIALVVHDSDRLTRGLVLALLPGVVTLAIEVPIVIVALRRHPDRGRVRRVATGTNLATYTVGVAIFAAVRSHLGW